MTPEQVVQKQLDAYSMCELDAFCDTYAADVKVIDGTGKVVCEGLDQLREIYGKLFKANPHQIALITRRITGGDWVIDDETVIGRADNKTRNAVAIYRVKDDKITHVTLIAK